MLTLPSLARPGRRAATAVAIASAALGGIATLPSVAMASHTQSSIIEDFTDLSDPVGTFAAVRDLGAGTVRVIVPWSAIAPDATSKKMPKFKATDPNAYPAANWAPFDNVVRVAATDGLKIDFTLAAAPRWADRMAPPLTPQVNGAYVAWSPNPSEFGQFVRALGTRYSGTYTPHGQSTPLPKVSTWGLFNEPNFGQDLGPQAIKDSTVLTAPMFYRSLANQAYNALHATGHAKDTLLIGELAVHGSEPGRYPKKTGGLPGNYGQLRPLTFLRALYCVDGRFRPLRGYAARSTGCPTNAAGTRAFRRNNPALFYSTGLADHPYAGAVSPTSLSGNAPDYATFPDLGNLTREIDRLNRIYGSGKHYPIYNTEYGYITDPPNKMLTSGRHYASPSTAATYINWAEYLSWRNPRIATTMQYLLSDPPQAAGAYQQFASGLEYANGKPKPSFAAYRLPVYMPTTSFSHRAKEEVWGGARPAPFMKTDTHLTQMVSIQLNGKTLKTVTAGTGGYFDTHMTFPHSGSVRLAWTYPKTDSFLPISDLGKTVYSRSFSIKVR